MNNTEEVQAFWQRFLKSTARPSDTRYIDCYHFTADEKLANELLALTLSGKKAATTSLHCLYGMEGDPLPQPGDLSIITDWEGTPKCASSRTRRSS